MNGTRQNAGNAQIAGSLCERCNQYFYPPRFACRSCGSEAQSVELRAVGTVQAWTTVEVAAEGFHAPYKLAYVVLEQGPRVLARISASRDADLEIGSTVVLRPFGEAVIEGDSSTGLEAQVVAEGQV